RPERGPRQRGAHQGALRRHPAGAGVPRLPGPHGEADTVAPARRRRDRHRAHRGHGHVAGGRGLRVVLRAPRQQLLRRGSAREGPGGGLCPAQGVEPARGGALARPEPRIRPRVRPALSPSRAADFKQCPLKFRFRSIDRLDEAPSPAAVRGTLVHAVLEEVFELPPAQRTPESARALLPGRWAALVTERPELAEMIADDEKLTEDSWLSAAARLTDRWFTLEDPSRFEP